MKLNLTQNPLNFNFHRHTHTQTQILYQFASFLYNLLYHEQKIASFLVKRFGFVVHLAKKTNFFKYQKFEKFKIRKKIICYK